jgi:hypothetical protein
MQNGFGNNISMDCEQDSGNLHRYKVELLSTLAIGNRKYNKHYEPTRISVLQSKPNLRPVFGLYISLHGTQV